MSVGLLVGDCGGTNTRLKLIELDTSGELESVARGASAPGKVAFEKKYQNEEYSDFLSVVKKFIEESGGKAPEAACLACAGPILGNTVLFTNIEEGWFIDGAVLEESLGIKKVMLVNDFTAMGYVLDVVF
ncbi:glucokinase, partial [Sphaeroforma arctica JP610]